MKLNTNLALGRQIITALGLDPKSVLRDQAQAAARARMEPQIAKIAADMKREGWVIGPGRREGDVIRDALFRLWRVIFAFKGGGKLVDVMRDSHDDRVIAQLAEPVTEATPLEELVRMAMEATLELAF